MKALILTGKLATYKEFSTAQDWLLGHDWKIDIATRGKETVYGELKGPAGLVQAGPIVPTMDIPARRLVDFATVDRPDRMSTAVAFDIEHDLLVLPGGAKAMEYLRQDRDVIGFIAAFHAAGGVIASICHAAQLLISAKLVKGRRIAGYYSIKDDIENAGGTFVDGVCVDGRIVSANHYDMNGHWMAAALKEAHENRFRAGM